jgi:twinkle protein
MEYLTDTIDFAAYLRATDHMVLVKPASTFVDKAKERLRHHSRMKKTYLPWFKTQDSFYFRPGEVTMVAGQNGHGKTDLTTQVALSLIGQNEKVCIASFEMKPEITVQRMVRMFAGTNPLSHEYHGEQGIQVLEGLYDDFKGWSTNLWLYDQTGTANAETVLGMVRYCAKELGITFVVIDSLMKCVKGEDDYNGQKDFIDQMCAAAKDCNIHIIIVHHLKKPANEGVMPDKHDTKGSGAITDQVDNLMMVWRNKPKEEERRKQSGKKQDEPDSYLAVRKQRNYEGSDDGEPLIALWRHRDAGQFIGNAGDSPMAFYAAYPHVAV